jgi:hypothetical protein
VERLEDVCDDFAVCTFECPVDHACVVVGFLVLAVVLHYADGG